MIKNKKYNIHYYFFFISLIFLIYNFNNDSGYWFDEWSTLLNSDPNVSTEIIYNRIDGIGTVGELVPKIYFLTLRFFFLIFGFSAENGRIFSIIFFILSISIFYYLLKLFLSKQNSLFIAGILSVNPFMLWMANETRVDTFNIFFCILNIYFFFKSLLKKKIKNNLLYIVSCVWMLSVHPLTIGVISSQIIYILILKKKKHLIFISLALIIYILFNFNYVMKGLSGGLTPGHTTIQLNFFFGYYFNIFFGNKYFGALYLILFLFLCLFNFKKIFKEKIILYSVIIIFLSYLMIILGYFFSFHIAAPRYIEFILPFIILFFIYNFNEAIIKLNKEYFSYSKLLIFIIIILNVFITNDNKPVKKPSTKAALNIIKSNNILHIYTNYDQYFSTYLKSINYFKVNNFLLLDNDTIIQKTDVFNFAFLCLKESKSNNNKNEIYNNKQCQKEFYNFRSYKIIDLEDYKIILYKNN
jgi:uncharacterized membrane protein